MSVEVRIVQGRAPEGASVQDAVAVEVRGIGEWRAAVSSAFAPLQVRAARRADFRGLIRTRTLGEVNVSEVAAAAQVVERTSASIEAYGTGRYMLCFQLAGRGILSQGGREAALEPGDISVYDMDEPYTLVFEQEFRSLAITVPRPRLGLPSPLVAHLAATRMAGDEGLSRVVSPFLVELGSNLGALAGAGGARLITNAIDLVTTVLVSQLESARTDETDHRHRALTRRILDFIDAHLTDPNLGPATIAAAHFISTRHLHAIFRAHGVSVSEWVRLRRLEQCRRDLADPALRADTVSAIAARSGFTSASHFSQAFRKTFGESATEFRQRALPAG